MKPNSQPPEKQVQGDGYALAVNSVFYTIQGEGPFSGRPAVFVRLAGCNLQCPMCDTEYTKRDTFPVNEIIRTVKGAAPSDAVQPTLVVITGGEPFRQPIARLVGLLWSEGYTVQIETNGTLFDEEVPYGLCTVVCSPKTGNVHRKLLPYISAFKYVATAGSLEGSGDGLPVRALGHPASPKLYRKPHDHPAEVYLQPVDEGAFYPNKLNQDAVVRSCMKYGHRLCIQTHKLIGVP